MGLRRAFAYYTSVPVGNKYMLKSYISTGSLLENGSLGAFPEKLLEVTTSRTSKNDLVQNGM